MTVLRDELRKSGAEYMVVKNRLVRLALQDLDLPDLSEWLTGPTGVIIGHSGPVDAAKAVADFAKTHDDRPVFKVGVLENSVLDASQIERLAKLPNKETLLAMLAGALQAPMAALAGALEAKLQEMSGLLEALREKKEGEGA
jgi:large subunit ribosomal protein L10